MKYEYDLIIVGGGAAGFFTAINVAEKAPDLKILILEKGKEVLSKVKISGGGRCNVTHAAFIPKELSKNYPRGEKELLGPFHTFMTGDVMEWFENRGVPLKIEEDGRVFPESDTSMDIINCFVGLAQKMDVQIKTSQGVQDFQEKNGVWQVLTNKTSFTSAKLMIATGSSPKMWGHLKKNDIAIVSPVPSLFTFNIKDQRIYSLPGLATEVKVKVLGSKLKSEGPLLITHWGMSGPAILKLSAWGAVQLHELGYKFKIQVNWTKEFTHQEVLDELSDYKKETPKKQILKYPKYNLPKRLWQSLVIASGITENMRWADVNKVQFKNLASQLTMGVFEVNGKSTFKDEFVTAGGVSLKEIDFKTYQSKKYKGLFFAGEVLNIDAITGGFNFQNAWTAGYIASNTIVSALEKEKG